MAFISAAKLRALLLNTGLQQKDNPLYQVIYELIGLLTSLQNASNGGSGGGGGGSTTINRTTQQLINMGSLGGNTRNFYLMTGTSGGSSSPTADYVVASDGGIPTPSPLNDGAGNFIYVPYTP